MRLLLWTLLLGWQASLVSGAVTDAVVTRNGPQLNQGRIKGSVRVMNGGSFNLNSGLTIDGTLILPGSPQFTFNGGFQAPAILTGPGSADPQNYRVTINGGVTLGGIKRRVDPELLPTAIAPVAGTGSRNVHLNNATDSPGDFATIRSLTINAQGRVLPLPPGRYDRITLNGGSTLQLQGGSTATPALYEIQRIDINGGSHITVDGPVLLRIANSLNLNGYVGNTSHPEWLEMSLSSGSLTLNSQSAFHGKAIVPAGRITVNGASLLHGLSHSGDLTLNGGGIIECEGIGTTPNLPPVATAGEISTMIGETVSCPLVATDPENAPLSFHLTTAPMHGSAVVQGSVAVYTPNLGFVGDDVFYFKASDGTLESQPVEVVVHVFQPNRVPVAEDRTYLINQGENNAPVTLSATDADGDPLVYQVLDQPGSGVISGNPPGLLYSHTGPRSGQVLVDSFTFTATDSHGAISPPATVTLQLQAVNRPPTAGPVLVSLNEDGNATVNLSGVDPDDDDLVYEIVSDPADPQSAPEPSHGTLSGEFPALIYQPTADFNGTDRFFYRVSDGSLVSEVVEVTLQVLPVNDPPVVEDLQAVGDEDEPLTVDLTATDVDGGPLLYSIEVPADFPGDVELTGSTVVFTPSDHFHGTASFSYSAKDSEGSISAGNIEITITSVNDAPIGSPPVESVVVAEDGMVTFALDASDADSDPLWFSIHGFPEHGQLVAGSDGICTYVPNPDFNGLDSLVFTVTDGTATSEAVTVPIVVFAQDDPPVAQESQHVLLEDTAVEIVLAGADVDGDEVAIEIVSQPQHGTLAGTPPQLIYTPAKDFHGTDSLQFKAMAGGLESTAAPISFTIDPVNDTPLAAPQLFSASEDSEMTGNLAATDADSDPLTFEALSQPQFGTLTLLPDGSFRYLPADDFYGTDSFTFAASDGSATSAPTVATIEVAAVNDVPIATPQTLAMDEDGSLFIPLNGSDVEGGPLSYQVSVQPAHGTLSGNAPELVYTPAQDFHGTDGFSFTVGDGEAMSQPVDVAIQVRSVNDAPQVTGQALSTEEDQAVAIHFQANDVDDETLSYSVTDSPAYGTLTGTAPDFVYTPSPNFHGTDTFTVTASDASVASAPAVFSIQITPLNDPPTAIAASYSLSEDGSCQVVLSGIDADDDSLTFEVVGNPEHGTLTGSPPNLTYTPHPDYNGGDEFTFTVADAESVSQTATIHFTVTPTNDVPISVASEVSVMEDTSTSIQLAGNDLDGDALGFRVLAQPAHGTLEGNAPDLTYIPHTNFHGEDLIEFVANDGTTDSPPASVMITVQPVDDLPLATPASLTVRQHEQVEFSLAGTSVDGDPLTHQIQVTTAHGTITGSGPVFTYTPAPAFNGIDELQFISVSNRTGLASEPASVTFNVTPNNLHPTAGDLDVTIDGAPVAITLPTSDPEGLPLAYTIGNQAATWVTITGAAPNLTLTRRQTSAAQTSFTYTVTDDKGLTAIGTVRIRILAPNRLPSISSPAILTMAEDATLAFRVVATDPDNDPLSYFIDLPTGSPCLLEGSGPEFLLRTTANYTGTTQLTARVTDGRGGSASRSFSLVVSLTNDAPVVTLGNNTVLEDTPLEVSIIAADPEGSPIAFSLISPPLHGRLIGNLPAVTYLPDANFSGIDQFVFSAGDGSLSSSVTVPVQVTPSNDQPTAERVTQKFSGHETSFALRGSDPDDDPLTYRLITQPGVGNASIVDGLLTFTASEPFLGNLVISYVANDGSLDSQPAQIVLTGGQPPECRILHPLAGARLPISEPLLVKAEGHDPDGRIIRYDLFANGSLVASSSIPEITWTPTQSGGVNLTLTVTDDASLSFTSAPMAVTVTGRNQAPVVFAGSDHNVFPLGLGSNLITNGGCELPVAEDGVPPFWTAVGNEQDLTQADTEAFNPPKTGSYQFRYFPAASEGAWYFGPRNAEIQTYAHETAKLTQLVQLPTADQLLFKAKLFAHLPGGTIYDTPDYRQPQVELKFLDASGNEVSTRLVQGRIPDNVWYPVSLCLAKPENATSVRITLIAYREPACGLYHYSLFDDVGLFPIVGSSEASLSATVSDDGLPTHGSLGVKWEQIEGPDALLESPESVDTNVDFTGLGKHVFKITATDGELSASDTVTLNVGSSNDENVPPTISLASEMTVTIGTAKHPLAATVTDDGLPSPTLYHFWEQVSGPAPASIADQRSSNTTFSVTVPGAYVFRLTSHDGSLAAQGEIHVQANCETTRQPIDLYIITDHTPSMFGPEPGVITDNDPRTPIYQARRLVNTLLKSLDPAMDRVSINKNDSASYNRAMPFTSDFDLAATKVIKPVGEDIYDGYSSFVIPAIQRCVSFVQTNARPDAKKIILHLNDGVSGAPDTSPSATQIAGYGITTFSVTMPNMKNDPINRLELSRFVSTPAHAFFVSSMNDASVLDGFFKVAFSSLCRGYNTPPTVRAGAAAYLPSLNSIFQPDATVGDDQQIDSLSFTWEQVSGPAPAHFSETGVLRPTVRFTQPGSYLLKLSVADGNTTASDTVFVMVGVTNPTPTPAGLIAYWPFDGTMRDLVGNRTLAPHYPNMPPVFASEARSGQSLDLSGRTHPFRQIDGELFRLHGAQTGMALSFWCKTPAVANTGTILEFAGYSEGANGNPYHYFSGLTTIYKSPARYITFSHALENGSTTSLDSYPQFGGTIDLNQWHHVVLNYDKTTRQLKAYTDGVLTNTRTYADDSQAPVFARNGQGLCIGPVPNTSGLIDWATVSSQGMFKGILDEVAVFDRTLTSEDIANLKDRNTGLVPPTLNPPPDVDAGENIVASLSQPEVELSGFASDDQADLQTLWSIQSGPSGGCVITNPSLPHTIATFSLPGIYTLKLEAHDGYHPSSDTVEIRVDQTCSSPIAGDALFWLKANGDEKDSFAANDLHWLGAPAYAAGKVGDAFAFTGSNGWLESMPQNLSGTTALTFEGWFKDDANGLVDQVLFEISPESILSSVNALKLTSRTASNGVRYYELQTNFLDTGGVVRSNYSFSGTSSNPSAFPVGEFYHLAVSVSKSAGASFFVNGVLIKNVAIPSNLVSMNLPSNSILRLGGRNSAQVYPKLAIDELSMYPRILDASEILSIYQAGASGKCPLWAQAPANSGFVDAGPSTILPDPAVHSFSGTYETNDFAANPGITWTQVSGPAQVTLTGADTLSPSGEFTIAGRYVFKLTVTDGVKSGSDTVLVDLLRANNAAPVITWDPPSSLQLPADTLTFSPEVTDDGLPNGQTSATWRRISGPQGVFFGEIDTTPDRFDATARFSAAGTYELELLVSDGALTSSRTFTVTVLSEPEPPAPNTAPLVAFGDDFIAGSKTVHLTPTVTDDGKPGNQLTATWDYDLGPAVPVIDLPAGATGPEATISFPLPGVYEIRLTVSDGQLSASDVIRIEVPDSLFGAGLNAAPVLETMEPQVISRPATQITLEPSFADPDGPASSYAYAWEQVGGPAPLALSNNSTHGTTATFTELGVYVLRFTLTDGPHVRSTYITLHHIPQPNTAPTLSLSPAGGQAAPMSTVSLTANASDDGLPSALTYEWNWLSSPDAGAPVFSAPDAAETQVTFPAAGDYVLYCRVSDGELSKHETITFRVVGEPFFEILSPQEGSTLSDEFIPEVHVRAFQNGGIVNSVTIDLDGANLGQAQLEPDSVDYFMKLPPMLHGSHSLTATLTLGDGTVLTRSSSFQLAEFAEEALTLEIEAPHEYTEDITAPTAVIATVRSPQLKDYKLEIAPLDAPQAKRVIASGTAQVDSASIGTLDPSLLQNGLHLLTLSGTTTNGLYAATTEKVMIDGNLKLGQFALAFEDMSIDLPGTPLSITRSYDSRDSKGGDFGPGWSLATSSVKIRKTRPLNAAWEQVAQTSGFISNWVFQVHPTQRKRVIISFPDGRTEIFDTGIRAAVPARADLPYAQRYTAIYGAKYNFTPVGSSQGKLEVEGDTEITWLGVSNDFINNPVVAGEFTAFSDTTANPTRFRYTEPGGASYIIDETLGLMAISDANGNTVTINRGGVHHSAGESLLFTRDTAGRITRITDPSGKFTAYQYDTQGRLVTFTNRISNTNRFVYGNAAFPHYLTAIDDGKNVRAVRTNYDADGRMVSQTDANGRSITFGHDVSNNRETVTDRLGNVTVHEFDDFGNITRSTDPLGGVTTRTYDANDNETSTTTPLGHTTHRAFDAKGNLLSEADPLGHVTRYSYDSEKRPLTLTDALNQATVMNYAASGNLLAMTDPSGASTGFGYASNGTLTSLTDANGTVTAYTHDAKGREKTMKVTSADGTLLSSEAYDYDLMGNRVRSIVFDGSRYLTTTYTYDAENRLTRTTHPDGTSSSTNYDQNGKVSSESNTVGTTSYTYDTRGNLTKTTYPGTNRFTTAGFDIEGRQTSTTDLAGNTTYTLYDALGRATATILPDDTMPATVLTEVADIASAPALADNPRTLTTYDADGRVIASTDPNGNTTTFEYDAAGRRSAVIDALGQTVTYTYDAAGRQTSVTDARGNTTSFIYDSAGRLTHTDLPDGTFTTSTYDSLGRRISSTDAGGLTTQYAYDPQGRLIAVTDPLGQITRYGYDWRGLQTTQTDTLGRVTRYEYDLMGRRTARVLPEGQREEMTYNTRGEFTAHKDFNGQIITRTYDTFTQNLLTVVAPTNHPSLTLSHAPARYEFAYDALGRRTSSIARNKAAAILSQETYTYDKQSRLTGYSGPVGGIGYAYDLAGNLSGAQSNTPGGYNLSYDYDALNRLVMVHRGQQGIDPGSTELAACNYDPNGNLNGTGYANGVQHAYTYNTLNRLTALAISRVSGSTPNALQGYAYQLDANGLRTHISELSGRSIAHTFDALQRLTSETIASSLPTSHLSLGTLTYTYDAASNRTSRTSTGTVSQLLPNQSHTFTANDRLSSDTYDANGNTTSSLLTSHPALGTLSATDVYSFDNRLIRRTRADGLTIDLTYNPDGHRLTKLVSQSGLTQRLHHYLTDPNNPTGYSQVVEEKDPLAPAAEQLKKVHLYGHDLIATSSSQPSTPNPQLHFYTYDGLGSVRGITDESGDLQETYDYDAYGTLIGLVKRNASSGELESQNIHDPQSTISHPTSEFLFTGEQWDSDLGMYFLRARYLNTQTGRFHTQDTYEGRNGEPLTLHKYLYVHGNPVMATDPSGQFELTLAGQTYTINLMTTLSGVARFTLGGAFVGGMFSGIDSYLGGGDFFAGFVDGAKWGAILGPFSRIKAAVAVLGMVGAIVGVEGMLDSFESGNTTQGIFRGVTAIFSAGASLKSAFALFRGPGGSRQIFSQFARDARVSPTPPPANGGNGTIGSTPAQDALLGLHLRIARFLKASDIRTNQQQVAAGEVRVGINRPDLQFTLFGRRIYIEYDRISSERGPIHRQRILQNDPLAIILEFIRG